MRILHVSSARTFGGGERHFVDLTRGLTERGHEVFAALRPSCSWKNRLDFLPPERLYQVSIRNSFGVLSAMRSEERRVGKECRSRRSPHDSIKKRIAKS